MNFNQKGKRLKLKMLYDEIDSGTGTLGYIYIELPDGDVAYVQLTEEQRQAAREGTF